MSQKIYIFLSIFLSDSGSCISFIVCFFVFTLAMNHGWGNQLLRSTSQKLQVPHNQELLDNIVRTKVLLFVSKSKKKVRRFFSKFYLICMEKWYTMYLSSLQNISNTQQDREVLSSSLHRSEKQLEQHPEILRPSKWYLNKMYVLLSKPEILKTYTLAQLQQEKCGAFLIPQSYLDLLPLVTKKNFCWNRDRDLHHFCPWRKLLIS